MSHGRHNASSEIAHLVAEVRQLTPEQALEAYGIEIVGVDNMPERLAKYNYVYDTAYDKKFRSLNEWAIFVVAQEMQDYADEDDYANNWEDDE